MAPERICKVDGCGRELVKPHGRGMCGMHWKRWWKHGDPLYVRPVIVGVAECEIDGCNSTVQARGWCSAHYTRWQRTGSPTTRREGEILNGCRVCPACGLDKTLSAFTAGKGGPCKACLARRKRIRLTFDPKPPIRDRDCECRECGGLFRGNARHNTYCSEPCQMASYGRRSQRRHALQSLVTRERFKREVVFERDDWTCGICGNGIDPALAWPDRMCAVVDHVIPVSRGGVHALSNVQAAHSVCNARKYNHMPDAKGVAA